MTNHTAFNNAKFDQHATNYDIELAQGISVSGEDKFYFAKGRVAWLGKCLKELGETPKSALDFGCGTGSSLDFLLTLVGVDLAIGLDNSYKCLDIARHSCGSERAKLMHFSEYQPRENIDLAFCNGVFHHIPPKDRPSIVNYIYRSLRPGGVFALWENNPWNPGTRYVMSRIPFDRDAIPLAPPETRALLRAGGFKILRTDFLFLFPRLLRWFRIFEPSLSRLPFGAQYQVLGRKV